MDSRAIIKRLKEDGWQETHVVGSHHKFTHPSKSGAVTVIHPKKDYAVGTEVSSSRRDGSGGSMLFPAVIHKDQDSCYSVTIPDMPGCFTAGDSIQEAVSNIQQAAECHYFGELDLPVPSDLEKWINDTQYQDGVWVLVDIDLSRLQVKARRVNITIPENLLSRIDHYVSTHHLTRSGLLAQAASRYMSEHP